jgi:hypothetical protein
MEFSYRVKGFTYCFTMDHQTVEVKWHACSKLLLAYITHYQTRGKRQNTTCAKKHKKINKYCDVSTMSQFTQKEVSKLLISR